MVRLHATTAPDGFARGHTIDRFTRVLRGRALYVLLGLTGLGLHLAVARPIYAWYDRIGAWVPLVVFLIALYKYIRQARKTVPILLIAAFQVYLFYSVPQFTQEALILYTGLYEPTPSAITTAVALVIAGELAFFLGCGLTSIGAKNRVNPFDRILPSPTAKWAGPLALYAIPSLAIHTLISLRPEYLPISARLPLTQFFSAYLLLVLLLYVGYRFHIQRARVMAYVAILVMSFTGFVQGVMGNIVNPVIILFVATWIWGGVIQKRWIMGALLAILIINPAKNQFRSMEYDQKDVASLAIVGQRLHSWKTAFASAWSQNPTEANLLETASRTNDLLAVAQVVDYVPSVVPHNYGEGMAVAFIYWIPRVFWPSKPASTDLLFNRYAIEFGYTNYEGTLTSTTGASAFTEGYWNLGAIGVVLFLFTLGVLLGIFFGNNGARGQVSIIVALVYYASVMLLIQPLSLTASSLITFSAGVWCAMHGLHWLAGGRSRGAVRSVRMRPAAAEASMRRMVK